MATSRQGPSRISSGCRCTSTGSAFSPRERDNSWSGGLVVLARQRAAYLGRRLIGRERTFDAEILQSHVARCPEGRDGREETQLTILLPKCDGQHRWRDHPQFAPAPP